MEVVIDEANGAGAAGSEAFREFDGVVATGRDGDGFVMGIGVRAVDLGQFTELFHEFVGTSHGAGEGAANADVEFAGSILAQAGVEGDHFDDFDGLNAELVGDPLDGGRRDVAKLMLHHMKKGENGGAFLVLGVMADGFVRLVFQFAVGREGWEHLGPWGFLGGDGLF